MMEVNKIKCEHCDGTGKCGCFNCAELYLYFEDDGEDYSYVFDRYERFKRIGGEVFCSICNGFGFLYQGEDGEVIALDRG